MAARSSRALVAPFAERLLAVDLPGLDGARRQAVVDFTVGRVDAMPSGLRLGVLAIGTPMRALAGMPCGGRAIAWLIDHRLPLVGEYVRLVRSLVYAYVWERWPATAIDGSAP